MSKAKSEPEYEVQVPRTGPLHVHVLPDVEGLPVGTRVTCKVPVEKAYWANDTDIRPCGVSFYVQYRLFSAKKKFKQEDLSY